MNFKLKALVAVAAMAASVPAFAAMQGAASGNGELLLNLRFYNGAGNAGGDDMSAVFDLGVTMNDFLSNRNTAGFNMSWDLNAANYGGAFSSILAFAGANFANIEYNVIALDNTGTGVDVGGARYLTTLNANTYPSLINSNLNGFQNMDQYVLANNARGTHATEANGASTAVQADSSAANPVYFGAVNGPAGDTWLAKTGDTTQQIGVAQNFWFLTTSSLTNTAQASKQPFGVDFDGDNGAAVSNGFTLDAVSALSATGTEFGKWSFGFDANGNPTGMLSFANPAPVPEASTYGMMLAGLGLVGFMARRRLGRTA